ncbi:MAG: RsmE family RNA methyltransferase [Egibacteraceae bacterium]
MRSVEKRVTLQLSSGYGGKLQVKTSAPAGGRNNPAYAEENCAFLARGRDWRIRAAIQVKGPHFFVDPGDVDGDFAALRGDDARHLTVVRRVSPGEAISLSDGAGRCWQARVVEVTPTEVQLRLEAQLHVGRPRPRLCVVHALPKGRKLDDVVQRLVEIGVDEIVPVHSARSDVRLPPARAAKAVMRWRAVAREAAKQSRRAWLPEIAEVGHWAEAFGAASSGVCCWEEATRPLSDLWPLGNADEIAGQIVLAIGPEGGLTPDEVTATGLPHASLGPTILRTDTAALVAASIVLHRLGRLG